MNNNINNKSFIIQHKCILYIQNQTYIHKRIHACIYVQIHSSLNLPDPSLIAANKVNAINANKRGSVSAKGRPVSISNCAKGPFPVIASPINEKAKPNCATRPTKSSLALVKPNPLIPKNFLGCRIEMEGS